MSGESAKKVATYQDVLDAPEGMNAEIIHGELVLSPRPKTVHIKSASGLGVFIGGAFEYGIGGPGGWWILDEPEVHLGKDIVIPDLAGWRTERMPELPDVAYLELAPDWACELLSPSTRRRDLIEKRAIYAREGIPFLWYLDPAAKILEAFRLDVDGHWKLIGAWAGDDRARIPPFEAIELDLRLLWIAGEDSKVG